MPLNSTNDVIDLLYNLSTACVELLAVDTAGIMVTADGKGSLQTVASSHERTPNESWP